MNNSSTKTSSQETEVDLLRQALLNTTKKYQDLNNLFLLAEFDEKCRLETEYVKVTESMVNAEGDKVKVKALRKENKSLGEKLETKCLEYKHLKGELENTKKERNYLLWP